MDSKTIHLLTNALHHGRMDEWPEGVSVLCAACGWFRHNVGWPAMFTGSALTFFFGRGSDGGPPPDYPNWPPSDKKRYVDGMVARRRAAADNPTVPDMISNWFHWASYAVSPPDTTTAANGCTKG